jgi:hypothetical protein
MTPYSLEAGLFPLAATFLALSLQKQSLSDASTVRFRDPRDILRALHILRC